MSDITLTLNMILPNSDMFYKAHLLEFITVPKFTNFRWTFDLPYLLNRPLQLKSTLIRAFLKLFALCIKVSL